MLRNRPTISFDGREVPNFATIGELSRAGVLSETALRRLLAAGELPGFYVGTRFYVDTKKLAAKFDDMSGRGK